MIDIILVMFFCYKLHRMANHRGLAAWPYLVNYIAGFLLMAMCIGYAAMYFFGKDFLQHEDAVKQALTLEPFAILFEVLLFIYFRNKILKTDLPQDEEDDRHEPPATPEKKDLSYFR